MSLFQFLRLGGPSVPQISVSDAHQGAADGEHIIIDVRHPSEWNATGRPKGAVGVTLQDPQFTALVSALVNGDKSARFAMSCRSGARSAAAVRKLNATGFENVVNVAGGFIAWNRQGLPVDAPPF